MAGALVFAVVNHYSLAVSEMNPVRDITPDQVGVREPDAKALAVFGIES
jgi:hypothetical protein